MIKKIDFIWVILLFCILFYEKGLSQSHSEYALIQRLIWENPPVWKLTKSFAESNWGTRLFISSTSAAQSYVMPPGEELRSAVSFHLDQGWNRMLFQECLANWIYAFGEQGSGTGQFLGPNSLDAHAISGLWGAYWYDAGFYDVYVADSHNHRIVKLQYWWEYPSMVWWGVIQGGGLEGPRDLDINDAGTFPANSDDYLWVLNGFQIKRFTCGTGALMNTYGYFESNPNGEGNFFNPTAVVCGRDPFDYYQPFSNNNSIYIADQGNRRIVWLWKSETGEEITWIKDVPFSEDAYIVDLEADIFGQIWAVDQDEGRLYKYTPGLYPLCYFGSFGTGENQFYYPVSISNTAGYLGCGNASVTESWTDSSGEQYFVIGTDLLDFEVASSVDYRWHYINYVLIDPSDVIIVIYDEEDQFVDTLFNSLEFSGACIHVWDGTDQSGQPAGTGSYRVVVTDSSGYMDIETGQRVNVVVKEAWLHHEYDSSLGTPGNLTGYQSGPQEITLNWFYTPCPDHWFTIYCDGCLCGATEVLQCNYTDSMLIPDRSYVYWAKANYLGSESLPSNADTVFVESKIFPEATSLDQTTDQSFVGPLPAPVWDTSMEVGVAYSSVYPGHFAEKRLMLKNPEWSICGFNLLIKLRVPYVGSYSDLADFHTSEISTDSTLIGSQWVQYPVRHCWIDTIGSVMSSFNSLSCRGQVADTTLPHCKYLWVKAWAGPDGCIPPSSNYRTLFKFGVDAGCISDTSWDRMVEFDLVFGHFYGRQYQEVPFKYTGGQLYLWRSVHGDANNDSLVSAGDIVFLVDYLYRGGPPPCIPESGDPNGDCTVTAGDLVYLMSYLYRGGPPPLPGCWHGKKQ